MSPRLKPPIFVGRASYAARRLRDAARLLPLVGLTLWLIPLLWPRGAAGQTNSIAALYIFASWSLLVAIAFWLSRRLGRTDDHSPAESDD